uniref:Uncharacterized protein n=1 Tax=Triticum urartu TaxID=4572 RepID=A0A8R7R3Z7_TRIUA
EHHHCLLRPLHHYRRTQTVDPCRRRAIPITVWCICGEGEESLSPVFTSSVCPCCCSLSPSVRSSAGAVRYAKKMREGGEKGKEQPDPAPSLFPSCMRPREVDGEGRRHGRRRYHCTVASTSRGQIWCGMCGIMHMCV